MDVRMARSMGLQATRDIAANVAILTSKVGDHATADAAIFARLERIEHLLDDLIVRVSALAPATPSKGQSHNADQRPRT